MKYDTVLFLRTPGQELLHSIIRFLYLKEAIFAKEELCLLIFISPFYFTVMLQSEFVRFFDYFIPRDKLFFMKDFSPGFISDFEMF